MFIQKKLFTKNECSKILELKESAVKSDGFSLYNKNGVKASFNEHKIYDNSENSWFLDVVKNFVYECTNMKTSKLNLDSNILTYSVGDKFSKHVDLSPYDTNPRIYTLGILLSDDFEGGDLVVYSGNDNSVETLNKEVGNCYIFESTIEHEVKEIESGIRNSLIIHIKNTELLKSNLI
jgi:Rps23 Pro-64 3,4-dihydroxylase Tpa1-like proline 4-hydroxylase